MANAYVSWALNSSAMAYASYADALAHGARFRAMPLTRIYSTPKEMAFLLSE